MNWKHEAMDKLREMDARKEALRNIPLERERLRCVLEGIRAAGVDGEPVKGSTTKREDRLLGCIVALEELDRAERQAEAWVDTVQNALDTLDAEERLILDRMYVCPLKGAVDRLCEELGMEKSSVYRRKEQALRSFTLALYGVVES